MASGAALKPGEAKVETEPKGARLEMAHPFSFKLAARYLVFALLLACGPGTPPPAALPEKKNTNTNTHTKTPAPVVRPSCSAMRAETSLDASIYSGIARTYIAQLYGLAFSPAPPHPIRGASWLYGLPRGERGAALYHLTSRGEIASLPLPIFPEAAVAAGDSIRILRGSTSEGPAQWVEVDVSTPDAPRIGPVRALNDFRAKDHVLALAASARHALIVTRPLDPPSSPLAAARYNVTTGRREAERPFPGDDRIVDAFCGSDGCALVLRMFSGRLVTFVFPEGGSSREIEVASSVEGAAVLLTSKGALAIWQPKGSRTLAARPLDALGRPIGEPFFAPHPTAEDLASSTLTIVAVQGRGGDLIALPRRTSEGTTWVIGGVSAEARVLGPFRELPLGNAVGLSAAPSEDGTLFVGTTSDVSSGGGFHAWSASISATFQGSGAVVESADLVSQAGEGRGGLYGLPLVRGAWAGALVVPTGRASDTKVIMMRRPCESASIP